jgi:hypothetical protein
MNWVQLAYEYCVGGLFFFITMYLCFREGGSSLSHPVDRRAFWILMLGFAGYLAGHILWILLARL